MKFIARKIFPLMFLTVGLTFSAITFADDESNSENVTYPMFKPSNIKWVDAPKVMPLGAKIAFLIGNPDKKGIYVIRCKLPANYEFPAHKHTSTEYITVISGTLQLGEGDKLDKHASRALPAGSFVAIPKGMHIYTWTKEETVVQIGGNGPWGTKYVQKTNDPRNNKK